ncbi:HOF1 [[Candida] subhashii]|uniref:HOF1 n=1 Tax=[Candida] subhashii TaxID=561895 RepID=A0A8J5QJ00_9ASCO|nr:HOF1 [[Candida] subhashii]KAG7665571.1 HOF1 [[Candida] subhashii]
MNRSGHSQPINKDFVNYFWGPGDSGFKVIQTRIKDSLMTLTELINFYQEKVAIEKEYIKKLERLNNKFPIGSHETGTLRKSLDKLIIENHQMVNFNQKFMKSIANNNLEKLQDFNNIYREKALKLDHHMSKVIIRRNNAWKDLEQQRNKYKTECVQLKALRLSIQTTWGKELEKNQQKYNKLNSTITATRKNYQIALVNYKEINEIYLRDWNISLNDLYKLELERIQICKVNCFNYCNHIATLCVDHDQSVDLARSVFAQIQPAKDLQDFSDIYGTGCKIFKDPEFIEFMDGQEEKSSEYTLADLRNPDYVPILSKQNSTYSSSTGSNAVVNSCLPGANSIDKQLPPVMQPPMPGPKTPSPVRKAPTKEFVEEPITQFKSYSTSSEPYDVFSDKEVFSNSNRSSNYSYPTTYSNYSTNSSEDRHWASPRRKEKQLQQVQEQITRRSTNDFGKSIPNLSKAPETHNNKVSIVQDFSIDFIAKALEDLKSGGDGDVNQFRRSVRRAAQENYGASSPRSRTAPTTPRNTRSDFVNDRNETATRYESINFTRPPESSKPRPKSMIIESTSSPNGISRTLSNKEKTRRSYLNLNSVMATNLTPINKKLYIGKAKARYSYKPQHEGELLFKKGWNMYIIHKQEDNWFIVELGYNCLDSVGMIGLVPGNYLIEGDDIF